MIQVVIVTVWMVLSPPAVHDFYSETGFEAFRTCKHIVDERVYVGLTFPFLIIITCTILATVNRNVPTGFRETLFIGKNFKVIQLHHVYTIYHTQNKLYVKYLLRLHIVNPEGLYSRSYREEFVWTWYFSGIGCWGLTIAFVHRTLHIVRKSWSIC